MPAQGGAVLPGDERNRRRQIRYGCAVDVNVVDGTRNGGGTVYVRLMQAEDGWRLGQLV